MKLLLACLIIFNLAYSQDLSKQDIASYILQAKTNIVLVVQHFRILDIADAIRIQSEFIPIYVITDQRYVEESSGYLAALSLLDNITVRTIPFAENYQTIVIDQNLMINSPLLGFFDSQTASTQTRLETSKQIITTALPHP